MTVHLRRWQKAALDGFRTRAHSDFLAVATPGAGKTTLALVAARQDLAEAPGRKLVVVAPTQHLKTQWAHAAEALDLHLETGWSARDGRLPADTHGLVTTYQQVAASAGALTTLARDAFVVLDEVHHAGDDRAWGDAVTAAFSGARVRLCLSGTPFRSDTRAIQRRHSLRRDDDAETTTDASLLDEPVERGASEEQLSLFSAISAVAVGAPSVHRVEDGLPARPARTEDDDGVLVDLSPLPLLSPLTHGVDPVQPGGVRKYRTSLRETNGTLTRRIARVTGLSHAQVNGELNRRVGLERISEATVTQLERRRDQASAWLRTA